ncbi:MAG: hypothetical protein R2911_26890 [Caldilineaceae bacterium]
MRSADEIPEIAPSDIRLLIAELAQCAEPRLRAALIALFLRHPEYADFVPTILPFLDSAAAERLQHYYTAAVYLQRFWYSTLRIYLGDFPLLKNFFGQAVYQLPPADEKFGESGLRALAIYFQRITGFDWLSTYDSAIDLLLKQLSLENHVHVNDPG